MDSLWSPWRYRYVADAAIADAAKDDRCIFCDALALNDDAKSLIVLRAKRNFIILNRFPYTTGHVMIVPYAHVADLSACDAETLAEMMRLAARVQAAYAAVYKPEGYNLGMNLGRWGGDTNFMTVVGETRVEPEELGVTYEKIRKALAG